MNKRSQTLGEYSNKALAKLQSATLTSSIASGLSNIFVTLYLLRLGFKVQSIFLYIFAYSVVMVLNNYSTYFVNRKLGIKYSFILGYLCQALFFLALFFGSHSLSTLILVSLVGGLEDGFIWPTRHFLVAKRMDVKNRTRQTSSFQLISQISKIISSFIVLFFAFLGRQDWLLMISTCLALSSILFVIRMDNIKIDKMSFFGAMSSIRKRYGLANSSYNVWGFGFTTLWSTYIAININSFKTISWMSLVIVLLSFSSGVYIGKVGDRGNLKRILHFAILPFIFIAPIMTISKGIFFVLTISYLITVFSSILAIPWTTLYYSMIKSSERPYQNIFALEMYGDTARMLYCLACFILSLLFVGKTMFLAMFIVSGVAIFGCRLMDDHLKDNTRNG